MRLFKLLTGAIVALGFAAGIAQATPVDFEVGAGTFVDDFSGCAGCTIDISLSEDLIGYTFDLEEGESEVIGFIDISAELDRFIAAGLFGISAALELDPPGGTSASQAGGGFIASAFDIALGALVWQQNQFTFDFGNGGVYSVIFDQGVDIIVGSTTTINATVTLDVAPIPLPAGAVLLLGGLGALGVVRRRKQIAAAAA